ncbi:MAG TPA: sulfotransferase [Noviherbaspirillum sp.]
MLKSLACMNVLPAAVLRDDSVVIVSGLPRSGTSMLMRILAFGGIEPLTDEVRKKNSRNPHGYFEWEAVKQKDSYIDWIDAAAGKSLKIVSRFVRHLPATKNYRLLFLHRDIDAVLRSQKDMARHFSDASWDDLSAHKLKDVYRRHMDETLAWIDRRPNMQLHQLHYEAIVEDPELEIRHICDFLVPLRLDAVNMVRAVDPTLNHASLLMEPSHA